MRARFLALLLLTASCGLGIRSSAPAGTPQHDARFGWLGGRGPAPARAALCGHWREALGDRDPRALDHDSFPEASPTAACFTPVVHGPRGVVRPGPTPAGCGFPDRGDVARLVALAADLRADGPASRALIDCPLPPDARRATLARNARVVERLAARARRPGPGDPYAAIVVPGYGFAGQREMSILGWRPGDRCTRLSPFDQGRLSVNVDRAVRAAQALRGGVAPIAIVSGGAVHSPLVEAFGLAHLLECELPVYPGEILLDPCADHTHTNLRNAGRWIVALGGRAGYVVTDDGLQDDYFQEWSGFELVRGSIDQRSLRDWGSLVGSWRQASRGIRAGFWFTPYRFWAEPRGGLGSLSCVD